MGLHTSVGLLRGSCSSQTRATATQSLQPPSPWTPPAGGQAQGHLEHVSACPLKGEAVGPPSSPGTACAASSCSCDGMKEENAKKPKRKPRRLAPGSSKEREITVGLPGKFPGKPCAGRRTGAPSPVYHSVLQSYTSHPRARFVPSLHVYRTPPPLTRLLERGVLRSGEQQDGRLAGPGHRLHAAVRAAASSQWGKGPACWCELQAITGRRQRLAAPRGRAAAEREPRHAVWFHQATAPPSSAGTCASGGSHSDVAHLLPPTPSAGAPSLRLTTRLWRC